ncbi:hypothetical protein [Solicola sp. PLA-1-18]|uniref:hypothetical protein n=1 Tax=Solicola sp. PLA-1-18 TaxID=3380532 RepID=UPI003B7F7076
MSAAPTVSPGAPSTPSGDEDPTTDVPDSDAPGTVPPDNPSGQGVTGTEPSKMGADEIAGSQGDDAASGGS